MLVLARFESSANYVGFYFAICRYFVLFQVYKNNLFLMKPEICYFWYVLTMYGSYVTLLFVLVRHFSVSFITSELDNKYCCYYSVFFMTLGLRYMWK